MSYTIPEAVLRRLRLPLIILFATLLLSWGLARDYERKHEDNNAFHATFARTHLHLGLAATKGQDVYYVRNDGTTALYGHHPPGAGLLLAAVFGATGHDSPAVVRSVAIAFHLLSLVMLYLLARRLAGAHFAVLVGFLFALLPMGAFYGRMVNHEILALPFCIILVSRYLAYTGSTDVSSVEGRKGASPPSNGRVTSLVAFAGAALAGAAFGWVTFFFIAACVIHALVWGRTDRARRRSFVSTAVVCGVLLFAMVVVHIAWAAGWNLSDLQTIFLKRTGGGSSYGVGEWIMKMISFHRRHFTVTGSIASGWFLWRWARMRSRETEEYETASLMEAGVIFLLASLGYLVVFNWGAWQHHYWQYPMLPGVVIAMALALRSLFAWSRARRLRRAFVMVIVLEILITSAVTLYKRHTRVDPYVVEVVERMRSLYL